MLGIASGSPTCPEQYLLGVRCRLASPEWTTDVALPLLATLLGLYVAYRVLRTQLNSDVALHQASRRAQIVGTYAGDLARAAEELRLPFENETLWAQPRWLAGPGLTRAVQPVRVLLADPHAYSEVQALVSDISAAWAACTSRRVALRDQRPRLHPTPAQHAIAVWRALVYLRIDLRLASEVLTRWDGRGDPPRFARSRTRPCPNTTKPGDRERWLEYYAATYETRIRESLKRHTRLAE